MITLTVDCRRKVVPCSSLLVTISLILVSSFRFCMAQSIPGSSNVGELIPPRVDVDVDIPAGKWAADQDPSEDAVAVVIGISQYRNVPSVDFARRDAESMKGYLIKMFGCKDERVITVEDGNATLAGLKSVIEEQLPNYVHPGKSDVFVYYSGHGVPDLGSKEPYFVPYDCDPNYPKSTGYSVRLLYDRLASLNARSVTVIIDACFSGNYDGGTLISKASPIGIRVDNPVAALDEGVVFTSSSAQQLANWYPKKRHGLFTYFFLKGLRGDADANGNHEITAGEMDDYLAKHVPEEARSRNRAQTPQIFGHGSRVLVRY